MLAGYSGAPKKWREIAPFVWQDANGGDRLAADVVDGKVMRFSAEPISPSDHGVPARAWWQTPAVHAAAVRQPRGAAADGARLAGVGAGAPPLRRALSAGGPGCAGASLDPHRLARCARVDGRHDRDDLRDDVGPRPDVAEQGLAWSSPCTSSRTLVLPIGARDRAVERVDRAAQQALAGGPSCGASSWCSRRAWRCCGSAIACHLVGFSANY